MALHPDPVALPAAKDQFGFKTLDLRHAPLAAQALEIGCIGGNPDRDRIGRNMADLDLVGKQVLVRNSHQITSRSTVLNVSRPAASFSSGTSSSVRAVAIIQSASACMCGASSPLSG